MSEFPQGPVVECSVCQGRHEALMLHGMAFLPCPQVPENMVIPQAALRQHSVTHKTAIDSIRRTLHNALIKLDNLESLTAK